MLILDRDRMRKESQRAISEVRLCKGCGYRLTGLKSRACPECGRPFDPSRRATYAVEGDDDAKRSATPLSHRIAWLLAAGALFGLHRALWLSDFGIIAFLIYPVWMLVVISVALVALRHERVGGLTFWMCAGFVLGALITVADGWLALICGMAVGVVAGVIREYRDLSGTCPVR